MNSLNDGLDIDGSNVYIEKVYINNAGNDCLDLSYGNYELENLELINCKDKGASIGESSEAKINKISISETETGLAVKDSSSVIVNEFYGKDLGTCVQLYRKKQEFGPSRLKVVNYSCKSENVNYIQKGSGMKKTEIRKEYKFIENEDSKADHLSHIRNNYEASSF